MEEVKPSLSLSKYNCPFCHVYCPQEHFNIFWGNFKDARGHFLLNSLGIDIGGKKLSDYYVTHCSECNDYTFWYKDKMVYPLTLTVPDPSTDMPKQVKDVYDEAAGVFKYSPRAAAALLRLGIESLLSFLNTPGNNLNEMIGNIVKTGIPEELQQGLDTIRYYGNKGIHPGEIDLNQHQDDVNFLFELINMIVEELISRKKRIQKFYSGLPESIKNQIDKRDNA
ncbi:DUF4145 domain-containing protein [Sporolactobacillus pectinivorans]|uniref:DUF4145 domain-containing protein n=1 Tax=Sporolactobacillus pectinivorans TaxID=1591408 RepID=UPI000C258C47|nr:DUF4145 domain-containing protein [Sporolactobacillus pectinivorans]